MRYILSLIIIICCSCNWAKEKTKDTVNKTGEVVAKAGSEFVDGVSKGVEKTFKNKVIISDELIKQGLKVGKIIINSTDSTRDNILTTYLIFDKSMEKKLTVKVMNQEGQEYGRVSQQIKGQKDEAKYLDFVFDKRTNIDGKGTITIE
jgi:hypothetical protein